MADLAGLLLASLNPDSRKQAEQNLNVLGLQQGFLSHLLRLVLDPTQDRPVRLAGSIYLKNITKHRWEEASFYLTLSHSLLTVFVVGRSTDSRAGQGCSTIRARTSHARPLQPSRQSHPSSSSRVCLSYC